MQHKTTITIPEYEVTTLQKLIDKYNRKFEKKGIGNEYSFSISILEKSFKQYGDSVAYYPVVKCEIVYNLPDIHDKWKIVGTIDFTSHAEGNLLFGYGGHEVPDSYKTAEPICEHCGCKRNRNKSYVIASTNGMKILQIGTTCINDFVNFDIETVLSALHKVEEEARKREKSSIVSEKCWYSLSEFVCFAVAYLREHGFTDEFSVLNAIRNKMFSLGEMAKKEGNKGLNNLYKHYTQYDIAIAFSIIQWARSLDKNGQTKENNHYHNIWQLSQDDYLSSEHFFYATNLVTQYLRDNKTVGLEQFFVNRCDWKLNDVVRIKVYPEYVSYMTGKFGPFCKVRARDDDNKSYYFTISGHEMKRDFEYNISGTIKQFQKYNNVEQTVLGKVRIEK